MPMTVALAVPDRLRDATLPANENTGGQRNQREQQREDSEKVCYIRSALVCIIGLVVVVRDVLRGGCGVREVDELSSVVQNEIRYQVEVGTTEARGRIPAGRCREGILTAVCCFNRAAHTAGLEREEDNYQER